MKPRSTVLFEARSVEFFECFLKELKCANVLNSTIEGDGKPLIIYVFDCEENSDNLLKTIRIFFPLNHSYQKENHFVLSVSLNQLLSITVRYYKNLFQELMNTGKFGYVKYQFDDEKFNLADEKTYNALYHHSNYRLLINSGLCVRYTSDYLPSDSGPTMTDLMRSENTGNFNLDRITSLPEYKKKEDWFVEINFTNVFADHTILKDLKSYQDLQQEEQQRKAFLMGTHAKSGAQSSVLEYAQDTTFEKRTLGIIFDFFQKPVSRAAVKKVLGYHHTVFTSDAKENINDQDTHFIKSIEDQIKKLNEEVFSSFPYPDLDIKQNKIKFLKLILLLHEMSPGYSLKQNLHCAQEVVPTLFEQAKAGESSRTRKILNDILNEKEQHKLSKKL